MQSGTGQVEIWYTEKLSEFFQENVFLFLKMLEWQPGKLKTQDVNSLEVRRNAETPGELRDAMVQKILAKLFDGCLAKCYRYYPLHIVSSVLLISELKYYAAKS